LTEQEAFEYEKQGIEAYGRINLGTGCLANLSDGGEGTNGFIHSDESKEKNRISHLGKKYSPMSEEGKENIRKAHLGKKLPRETIRKIVETRKNNNKQTGGWKLSDKSKQNIGAASKKRWDSGFKHSEEALKKMSEAHKGRVISEETRQKISETSKGRPAWNKGLTKEDHPAIMASSKRMKGNKFYLNMTEKSKAKIAEIASKTHKGKIVSEETKRRMRESKSKSKNKEVFPCQLPV
jgi:hypothetical protein